MSEASAHQRTIARNGALAGLAGLGRCLAIGLVAVGVLLAPGCARRIGSLASIEPATSAARSAPAESTAALIFAAEAAGELAIPLVRLREACGEQTVEVDDPYHARRMRYAALPLACALELGFAAHGGAQVLRGEGVLLRALDGYTRPVSGGELLEPGGWLAFGEPDRARGADPAGRFTPIDRGGVDPAPFYLVWAGEGQNDPHDRPWPYQLARIEIAPFAKRFPHTVPLGLAEDDPGWAGFVLFQRHCASCHAINGQGGKIGPDLNVPRSIVEYRPLEQIRGYIRDPQATRYTSMPGHPGLSDADLDELIAYFEAMRLRKRDPRARTAREES